MAGHMGPAGKSFLTLFSSPALGPQCLSLWSLHVMALPWRTKGIRRQRLVGFSSPGELDAVLGLLKAQGGGLRTAPCTPLLGLHSQVGTWARTLSRVLPHSLLPLS